MSIFTRFFPQAKAVEFLGEHGVTIAKGILVISLIVSWTLGAYFYGRKAEREVFAQEQAEIQKERANTIAEQAKVRIDVAQLAADRRAALLENNKRGLNNLDEAIKKSGRKPNCDLTPDELRAFSEIGKTD